MTEVRIEAVQRLEQTQRRDLEQIVERLRGGVVVASRETARERHESPHECVARSLISLLVPEKQLTVVRVGSDASVRPG